MAEITISPDEIRSALKDFVAGYKPERRQHDRGRHRRRCARTASPASRVCPARWRTSCCGSRDGTLGLALNLDEAEIGVIVLGDFTGIVEGLQVTRTGEVLSVPVGDAFLGRVIDPLGQPIDGLGEIKAETRRALELQAPGVMQRKSVHEPMQTGIKAIDAMIPIGRGQRQLIIGDRQTGKTAIAIDTIINQKANWDSGDVNKQVRCIYVAIGQRVRPSPR